MARFDHLTSQCDEVLMLIFCSLDGKSVLRLSQTCRKLHRICTYDQQLWSRMCLMDFTIGLVSPQPFASFRHLYKCLYQSREILGFYLSDEYQDNCNNRFGVLPSWLWTWIVFNTNPPLLPDWIRNYHEPLLRYKLGEIALGKTLRVWCLKSGDLPDHIVTRVEYGTSYYRWRDIQVAAMRVHGGPKGLETFMLKRCWRARGYVERAHERIQNGTFIMLANRSKSGQSSAQVGEGSQAIQISQIFAQIPQVPHVLRQAAANGPEHASRQVVHVSGQVANAPQQVAHGSGLVSLASRYVVHVSGQIAHGSEQVPHGSEQLAHGSGQVGHGSGLLGSSENAHGSAEVGETSRNPVQYVYSSSSNSSMEID